MVVLNILWERLMEKVIKNLFFLMLLINIPIVFSAELRPDFSTFGKATPPDHIPGTIEGPDPDSEGSAEHPVWQPVCSNNLASCDTSRVYPSVPGSCHKDSYNDCNDNGFYDEGEPCLETDDVFDEEITAHGKDFCVTTAAQDACISSGSSPLESCFTGGVEGVDFEYMSCRGISILEQDSNEIRRCQLEGGHLHDCCVGAVVTPVDPDDIPSHGPISEAGDFAPDIKPEKMPEGMRDLHDKFSGKPKPHHTFKGVKKIGDPVIPGFRDKLIPGHKPEGGEPSEESCLDIISEYAWRTEIDEATACCIVEEANSLSCFDKPGGEERDACLNGAASSCGSFGPNDLIEIRH